MQTKRYCDLLGNKDYKHWAHQLKKKGYASSPVYTQRLIHIIEKYKLTIFDVC
jgi:flagellum-specific peptidoglycan hydrolase FlgJ